jgi:hypothetical protein
LCTKTALTSWWKQGTVEGLHQPYRSMKISGLCPCQKPVWRYLNLYTFCSQGGRHLQMPEMGEDTLGRQSARNDIRERGLEGKGDISDPTSLLSNLPATL